MECIRKELVFKRMLMLFLAGFILISAAQVGFEVYELNRLHREKLSLMQNVIGEVVGLYPEKEVEVVKAVLNGKNEKARRLGEEVLSTYGLDTNTKIYENPIFKDQLYISIIKITLVLAFILLVNIMLLATWTRGFTVKINRFSEAVESIMEGNFVVDMGQNAEGIFSRLASQFYTMARRLELSLQNLKREKENIKALVTDISHQLKTPLASVKLFNTLLAEELSSEERAEFLERSNSEVHKLEWLVGDLIKLSRLEAGMIELQKENANIKDTIFKAMNGVYPKAEEKDIDLELENIQEHFIEHDQKWTQEAIFNVLENSVKYTEAGGHIKLRMSDSDTYIRIEIEDNGIGIPKEEYNAIFKRFYRGSSKRVKDTEGSGVGLYLTQKILEEQGGSIMVDSIEGIGSKFILFLQKCKS